jgi:hypothetical protein
MLNKNISITNLQFLLDKKYGREWLSYEPETIMAELGFPDYLVLEKIFVLHVLNKGVNDSLALPEFLLWATSVTNNEYAEFEHLELPNCLQLAWLISEAKKVATLIGQDFKPREELCDCLGYLLRQEGFSSAIPPFEFIPEKHFHPGQTEEDTKLKAAGIKEYISFMSATPSFIEEKVSVQ